MCHLKEMTKNKIVLSSSDYDFRVIPEDPERFVFEVIRRAEKQFGVKYPISKYKAFLEEIISNRVKNRFNASVKSRKTEFIQEMIYAIERLENEQNS
jgi:hypothetical protein